MVRFAISRPRAVAASMSPSGRRTLILLLPIGLPLPYPGVLMELTRGVAPAWHNLIINY
jgi:hypothetical protein